MSFAVRTQPGVGETICPLTDKDQAEALVAILREYEVPGVFPASVVGEEVWAGHLLEDDRAKLGKSGGRRLQRGIDGLPQILWPKVCDGVPYRGAPQRVVTRGPQRPKLFSLDSRALVVGTHGVLCDSEKPGQ